MQYYILWLVIANIATFALYAFDKSQAKKGADRVPERTLHLFALVGGFVGGWIGRLAFRHKTQKPIFTVVLVVATLVHSVGGYLFWRL
jgi:uncharacterized membrane protein YsdA (DUF1294 family)